MSFVPPLPTRSTVPQALYDAERDKLRRVAKYQRWVLLALLVNIVIMVCMLGHVFELYTLPTTMLYILGVIRLPTCLFMTAMWFLLAKQLWHIAAALLGIALMIAASIWVPVATIIVVLIINQKATRYLQRFGIHVGLLGADYNKI